MPRTRGYFEIPRPRAREETTDIVLTGRNDTRLAVEKEIEQTNARWTIGARALLSIKQASRNRRMITRLTISFSGKRQSRIASIQTPSPDVLRAHIVSARPRVYVLAGEHYGIPQRMLLLLVCRLFGPGDFLPPRDRGLAAVVSLDNSRLVPLMTDSCWRAFPWSPRLS